MPHYSDGTEASVGDVVKGKGYNVKGADGQLKEIVGTVVGITPGSASCNIQVAHTITDPSTAITPDNPLFGRQLLVGCGPEGGRGAKTVASLVLEYGQCDHFVKILSLLLVLALATISEASFLSSLRSRACSRFNRQPTQVLPDNDSCAPTRVREHSLLPRRAAEPARQQPAATRHDAPAATLDDDPQAPAEKPVGAKSASFRLEKPCECQQGGKCVCPNGKCNCK